MRPEIKVEMSFIMTFAVFQFLNKLGAPKEPSKGGKKFRRMTSMLTKVQEAIHEMEVKKTPEYAMYPKIDVVRLNPTALNSQEVLGHFISLA